MGICGTCRFEPAGGLKGHTAKRCALKEFVCPRSLPQAHPLRTPGECLIETCIHHAVCPVCMLKGHRVVTQSYATTRWIRSTTNTLVRKRRQTALKLEDFDCRLLSQEALDAFLESVRSEAGAASQVRRTAEEAVSRIAANSFQSKMTVQATADLMVATGTRAATVHPDNATHFASLMDHAPLGAVVVVCGPLRPSRA